MKNLLCVLFLLFVFKNIHSQKFEWWSASQFEKSYISEMYSPLSRLEIATINRLHPTYYKENPETRAFNEVQTGLQIPVFQYFQNRPSGDLKIGFSIPISALLLIDMFESVTAPLINNDYRFGGKITALYSPYSMQDHFIKNFCLTIVPLFHESSHIGDEYALHGYNTLPGFKRINLSYEAWQLFFGINRPDSLAGPLLSAEIGYQRLMPYKEGYYNADSLEVKGIDILPSQNRDLWLMRMNYQQPVRSVRESGGQIVVSAETRRETKMGYIPENPERIVWSFNSYAGYRIPKKNSRHNIGIYFRHYRGLVPYGQLRDKANFRLNAISLVIK